MKAAPAFFEVRNTQPKDFAGIAELCRAVYPDAPPWNPTQLGSHINVFPEGQCVAVEESGRIVGMSSSLIILWDDYDIDAAWKDFTDAGMFTNHDPQRGRTLYGAEVFVDPGQRGKGIGKALYQVRRELVTRLSLLRIRAGARLRDYHKFAAHLTPPAYVRKVVNGEIADRTLTFQLRQGFRVLSVVSNYLQHDPESQGHAAVIEWLNPAVAQTADQQAQERKFQSLLSAP